MLLATVRRGTQGSGEPLVSLKQFLVWLLFLHTKKLKRRIEEEIALRNSLFFSVTYGHLFWICMKALDLLDGNT